LFISLLAYPSWVDESRLISLTSFIDVPALGRYWKIPFFVMTRFHEHAAAGLCPPTPYRAAAHLRP
jgi:hypothetical protein